MHNTTKWRNRVSLTYSPLFDCGVAFWVGRQSCYRCWDNGWLLVFLCAWVFKVRSFSHKPRGKKCGFLNGAIRALHVHHRYSSTSNPSLLFSFYWKTDFTTNMISFQKMLHAPLNKRIQLLMVNIWNIYKLTIPTCWSNDIAKLASCASQQPSHNVHELTSTSDSYPMIIYF